MNGRVKSLIGQRFDKLVVLREHGRYRAPCGQTKVLWDCRCDCGNKTIASGGKLRHGSKKSCGCIRRPLSTYARGSSHASWTGHEEISGAIWRRIIWSAKTHGHEFKIDIRHIWDLFIKQGRKCALSGKPLWFAKSSKEIKEGKNMASLDRIDSQKGYVPGNIQWVHPDVNYMKQDFMQSYFVEMCQTITNHQGKISQ